MKSEQVMLSLVVLLLLLGGCTNGPWIQRQAGPQPQTVYADRVLWAVVPLRNESGSSYADGLKIADRLTNTLQTVDQIDVVPVNRVIAVMEALELLELRSPADVMHVARTLGVDGIIVGTVTAYDPYDPPKLGLQIEFYLNDQQSQFQTVDVRKLTQAATGAASQNARVGGRQVIRPFSLATAMLDASNPVVRQRLAAFAAGRGGQKPGSESWWRYVAVNRGLLAKDDTDWHLYRISMDLFTDYASHELVERLLQDQSQRLGLSQRRPHR